MIFQRWQFSEEEYRVWKECKRDSFWYRSLPAGAAVGAAAYYAVRSGYLKPNAKFGALPKVALGFLIGYAAGKISYRGACAEKLMALPDSKLAEAMRQRQTGRFCDRL